MRMVRDPVQLAPCVLVLGMFDGVHRGHQALLTRGGELADAADQPLAVCTYDPHPMRVLRPDNPPPMLTTLPEKAALMAAFGVDDLCVTAFTREKADQPPEAYLAELARVYRPSTVVCGYNFSFGRGGRGDPAMLRDYGEKHGFRVAVVPEVTLEGATVSSTRIRRLLREGALAQATRLMGHAYTLTGRVEGGKHIGRTMGFPTANVTPPPDKVLPAFGVYACWLEAGGRFYPAVVNVGRHPTLPEGPVTVEAYALDTSLSLYDQKVRLTFLWFQRPERRFDGVDDLRAQIARDAEACRAYFTSLL